jgi:hypothetical protein
MLKSKLTIITLLLFIFFLSYKINAQDNMMPPKPAENKMFDAMTGEWSGEDDMMGMKMTDNVKIYWNLNHQYLFMELTSTSKDNPAMSYHGLGIYGFDKTGNVKEWWFDDWGAEAMATGNGTIADMNFTSHSTNPMYTDDRTITFKGNDMVMTWTSTMKDASGKEMKMNGETVYKKK